MVKESDLFEVLDQLEMVKSPLPSLSAHFDSYETLLDKIKLTCTNDSLNLGWEEDTDDEVENEEVLGFRKDFDLPGGDARVRNPLGTASAGEVDNIAMTNTNSNVDSTAISTLMENGDAMKTPDLLTTSELEDSFNKELTKATIKADFDERYIQSSLERRRLGLSMQEPVSTWKQSIQANPLTTLENISRSVLERAASIEFEVGTIKELEENTIPVEIAQSSQKYSHFLPLDAPILDLCDFDL
jgi:hypothetical protein